MVWGRPANCGRVFRCAVVSGRAWRDITRDLLGALTPVVQRHHASIVEPTVVVALLRAIDGRPAMSSKLPTGQQRLSKIRTAILVVASILSGTVLRAQAENSAKPPFIGERRTLVGIS